MNLSQFIKKLQEFEKKHGDKDVGFLYENNPAVLSEIKVETFLYKTKVNLRFSDALPWI